jgi:multiple sugar transport system permease protein
MTTTTSDAVQTIPPKKSFYLGKKRRQMYLNLVAYIVLGLGALTTLVPFYWMVASSLKSIGELMQFPPTLFPQVLHFENYEVAFRTIPFGTFFKNSALVSFSVAFGQLFTCSLAGYAFARLRFPGRDKIFFLYLSTMMIPFAVVMIPLYVIIRTFGWLDNLLGLIVPALVSVFGTFLMRQFFSTIPKELEDAARIDGCSYFQLYWMILTPLAMPALATLGILSFMGTWNDFMWPLIVINQVQNKTLPLGLLMLINMQAIKTPWNLFNAAGTFSIIPILIIFTLGQKYYVQGIVTSGLKGSA